MIPGLGRSPGEGNGNPLQYSSLENPVDRGTWQATVHGVAESGTTEQLTHTHRHTHRKSTGKKNQQKIAIQGLQLWQGPCTARAGELLERGEKEVGRAVVNKEPWLFIGLSCGSLALAEPERLSSSCWALLSSWGLRPPPSGQHVVTILL